MLHLMKNDVKIKLRNFNILFWPLVFPIILGTLYYFAFGQVKEADYETVPVAVVQMKGQAENPIFRKFLKEMEEGEQKFIETEFMEEETAIKALKEKKVSGIYYTLDTPSLTVGGSGMGASILQSILDSYLKGKQTMETIAEEHPEGLESAALQLKAYKSVIQEVSLGGKSTNGMMTLFYALIGMACMYGSFIGFGSALLLQANLTALAARRCITPTHKLKLIVADMITSFGLHFANVVVLILYLRYVLQMEFKGQMSQMLLVAFIGCMLGVSMGLFISSILRGSEGMKTGVLLGISMICCFLAGLMSDTVKPAVDEAFPLINRLNPAALISDAFYCINVYNDPVLFRNSLVTLTVMSVVLTLGAFLAVRRERYDSI